MISCPMIDKGYSCKSNFYHERDLVRHLVQAHSAFDVAEMLVNTILELIKAQYELEKLTVPKAEENKSEGAIP